MGSLKCCLIGFWSLGILALTSHAQDAPSPSAPPSSESPAAVQPESAPLPEANPPPPVITLDPSVEWHFTVAPYVWMPALDGNVTVRGRLADVSLDLSDVWDLMTEDAKFVAQAHLEAEIAGLSVFTDIMYYDLEDRQGREVLGTVEVGMEQGIFELGLAYALIDDPISSADGPRLKLEPLAGARIQYLESTLDVQLPNIDASGEETWVDAFGGVRLALELNRRVTLFARGDAGGGGSDLTWNALAGVDVHIARRFSLVAGYRALYTDFSDGHGNEKFGWDITLYGPFVGMVFRF